MNDCERGSSSEKPSYAQLVSLNESLRLRLAEAEAALQSLRTGKVDPDVVSSLDQSGSPGDFLVARNISRCLQAEETPHSKNDLLQMTGEIASVGGWEFDVETMEGRWTEEVARIHEVDPDPKPDVAWGLGFYTEDSRPKLERAVNDAITRAMPFDLELEIAGAKGTRKWVRTKGVPVVKDGKVVQVRGILQDITERKRTERSLEESQARMAAIVKTAVDAIITIDDQGIVRSFNPAAEKIFGYSGEEIVGKNVSLLMPSPHREEHAQHLARFKSTGESRVLGVDREILALRKDGSCFPIEIGVSAIHIHGIQMFVGILRDVSERRLAQEALRRSEQRYRRIVETAREGVWIHDVEGRTTFVNASMAEMLGYSVGELEGRPLFDFIEPELRAAFQVYLERRRQGIGETHDFQFRCGDGSPLWAIVSASPLKDDQGRVIGVLKMITDITERRWAEQELMSSERRFRDIARNIPGVVFQFRVRPDGTHYFSFVSPRAQEILSLEVPLDSPDWFLGSGVHPDDRQDIRDFGDGGDLGTARLAIRRARPRASRAVQVDSGPVQPARRGRGVGFQRRCARCQRAEAGRGRSQGAQRVSRGAGRRSDRRAGVDAGQRHSRSGLLRSRRPLHPDQPLPGRVQRHSTRSPSRSFSSRPAA